MARSRRSISPSNSTPQQRSARKIERIGFPAAVSCRSCVRNHRKCIIMSSNKRCSECARSKRGQCLAISGLS
jgi:thioredoxin-related protein